MGKNQSRRNNAKSTKAFHANLYEAGKNSFGSKCEMKTEVDTGCVGHQYTNFGYTNLGMPKPNFK